MDGHQRQREQSARMIEEALFCLMGEKRYEEITVSELVKRADVARRTFYRLYAGKEEVLHRYFGRLCEEYRRTVPVLEQYDLRQIAEEFFGFWYAHRRFLLLLYNCGLEELLYSEIRRASDTVVRGRIGGRMEGKGEEIACFAAYSAGGFLMLLHRWIADGMEEPPQSYARRTSEALLTFIRPVSVP